MFSRCGSSSPPMMTGMSASRSATERNADFSSVRSGVPGGVREDGLVDGGGDADGSGHGLVRGPRLAGAPEAAAGRHPARHGRPAFPAAHEAWRHERTVSGRSSGCRIGPESQAMSRGRPSGATGGTGRCAGPSAMRPVPRSVSRRNAAPTVPDPVRARAPAPPGVVWCGRLPAAHQAEPTPPVVQSGGFQDVVIPTDLHTLCVYALGPHPGLANPVLDYDSGTFPPSGPRVSVKPPLLRPVQQERVEPDVPGIYETAWHTCEERVEQEVL